ncbi:MAG: hypothetical protein R3E79_17360 [Caldilineaceae bacterium]
MAGISATLSQEDLKFMAEDIGRELMAFLPVEDRLAGVRAEQLLQALPPEECKRLFERMLKTNLSTSPKKREGNGNSN